MKPLRQNRSIRAGIVFCYAGLLCFYWGHRGDARARDPADLCDQAAGIAAKNSNVPVEILLAITRVETGRSQNRQVRPWPWTVNLDGRGYWFDTSDEATDFANQNLIRGIENFDVGCFQINLRWHGSEFDALADVFDPQSNADYAARFLTELYNSEGTWEQAVAAYHSRTPALAAAYLQKVEDTYAALQTAQLDAAPAPVAASALSNRFPLLQTGKSAGTGSLVPLQDAATPFIVLVQ